MLHTLDRQTTAANNTQVFPQSFDDDFSIIVFRSVPPVNHFGEFAEQHTRLTQFNSNRSEFQATKNTKIGWKKNTQIIHFGCVAPWSSTGLSFSFYFVFVKHIETRQNDIIPIHMPLSFIAGPVEWRWIIFSFMSNMTTKCLMRQHWMRYSRFSLVFWVSHAVD